MTFKQHAMGKPEDRPVHEQFEAKFHQLLCPALDKCVNMGNKKKQGYIMGAFREALADFRVKTPEQAAHSIELTREQGQRLLEIVSTLQASYQDAEIQASEPELVDVRKHYREQIDMLSGIKVKLVVHKLMEVKCEQVK